MAGEGGPISAKYALTDGELQFCRVFLAFGKENAAEAFRRAFPDEAKGKPAKEVSRRASNLRDRDHIQRYLRELEDGASDQARAVLADQVRFGDDTAARRAAEKILDQEDKLGFRSAADKWAEIMCAVGAEVVVPLKGGGEAAFELRHMFPRYREALPPVDVLEKTIRALTGFKEKTERGEVAGFGNADD